MTATILRPAFPDHEAAALKAKEAKREATRVLRRRLKHWRATREWEPTDGGCWCPPCPRFDPARVDEDCGRCHWPSEVHG